MYDSPTSMDFDSEFSPQSIYDDRDSLNNSFGGRNRQLSTNIRYMEEEEDEINRSHNRRNNNNYNNSNSNRSVNLGGAYVENERRANAVNFERLVNEVGLHELFRNICVDILVQKPDDVFRFTVARLKDEARRRRQPRRPEGSRASSYSNRSVEGIKKSSQDAVTLSPREQRVRDKQRQGVIGSYLLLHNLVQRYRFTCDEAKIIFELLGGHVSRNKMVSLKAFAKAVGPNASYTDGRMDFSSVERLFELLLWSQPARKKSMINVCEACAVLAAVSNCTIIERMSTILYFVAPEKGCGEDRTFIEAEITDALKCFLTGTQLVASALSMRQYKVRNKSSNRIEAIYRMDAKLMNKKIKKFGIRIWNSEHRKFGRIPLQNVISQMTSGNAWGGNWPTYWHLELQSVMQTGEYGGAINNINGGNGNNIKDKNVEVKKGSDDQVIADWAFRIMTPLECRLIGAAKKRIRPLKEPLVKPVVERAQMSQEELFTRKYIARLKWIEEENRRANERAAREQEAKERKLLKLEEQLSRENEVLELQKDKLRAAERRRQEALERERVAQSESMKHKNAVASRANQLKPGISAIEDLLAQVDAWAAEKDRLVEIEEAFFAYADQNENKNRINYDQVGLALCYLGFTVDKRDVRLLLCILDADQDGHLSLKEFLGILPAKYRSGVSVRNIKVVMSFNANLNGVFTKMKKIDNVESKTKALFDKFDVDHNGDLSIDEFKTALTSLGIVLDDKELHNMMNLLDKTGDGKINVAEFGSILGETIKVDNALTIVQSKIRGDKARMQVEKKREEKKELDGAASKIQAIHRGRQTRIEAKKQEESAVAIQKTMRGKIHRKKAQNKKQQKEAEDLYKNPTEETHIAAAKIQAIQRGKADRERVQELKDQTKAQTKIAAVQRGRKARLEVEEKKEQTEAVKKIQAVQRGRQARQELEDQTKAAGKIAALHRGNVARKQVDNMQAEKDKYVPMDQKEEIGAFLLHIWNKYDADNSGGIDAEETKEMIQDITKKEVSTESCEKFLASIDTDGDMLIQQQELADFVHRGLNLSDALRQQYASRGELHAIIVEFFYGIDRERVKFREQLEKKHNEKIKMKQLKRKNSSKLPTKYDMEQAKQSEAAVKIQAVQRGKQDREKVQELKDQTEAAKKIQAIQRGKQDRAKVEELKNNSNEAKSESKSDAVVEDPIDVNDDSNKEGTNANLKTDEVRNTEEASVKVEEKE